MTPSLANSPDGRVIALNKSKLEHRPYFLLTDLPNNIVSLAANQSSGPFEMGISGIGAAMVMNLMATSTGTFLTLLEIDSGGGPTQRLMNEACHSSAMWGTGLNPYFLPQALYIDQLRSLLATFTDVSGSANSIRIAALAQRYVKEFRYTPSGEKQIVNEIPNRMAYPFWYTLPGGGITVTAGTSVQRAITVDRNHHFQLFQISFNNPTGTTSTMNIINGNTGESVINAPGSQNYEVDTSIFLGSNTFPLRFHQPRLFKAGEKIILNFTNTGAIDATFFFSLCGRAIPV